jgi:hypothetical protein
MNFIVRMQLNCSGRLPNWGAFYVEMGAQGFVDVIRLSDGSHCRLPDGEWKIEGVDNADVVWNRLAVAAIAAGVSYTAIAVEFTTTFYVMNPIVIEPPPPGALGRMLLGGG